MKNGVKIGANGKKICESQHKESFSKGEQILTITEQSDRVGVLLRGEAHICCVDREGRENTLEMLIVGDCFGDFFLKPLGSQEYIVIADTNCEVMFIHYARVLSKCQINCENHNELLKTLFLMTAQRAQALSRRVNVLSQRTLRAKLLTYLGYLRKSEVTGAVTVPMTFGGLADYLSVDRSAMMREIRKMNEEGVIRSEGRSFYLLG